MPTDTVQYTELKEDSKGFTHIALYEKYDSKEPTNWLTSGEFEVTEILCNDPVRKRVYVFIRFPVDTHFLDSTSVPREARMNDTFTAFRSLTRTRRSSAISKSQINQFLLLFI